MLFGCAKSPEVPSAPSAAPPLTSGIDIQYFDASVRSQDDFYKHINGKWLADTEIPPDKGGYGTFSKLSDEAEVQLRGIIDGLQKSVDPGDPNQQKIADLYFSFMDEPTLESLGIKPLSGEFARIDALKDKKELAGLIAHFNEIGVTTPYSPLVHQDAKDSTRYVFDLEQDGLGMPDRDYYLLNDDKMKQARARYGAACSERCSSSPATRRPRPMPRKFSLSRRSSRRFSGPGSRFATRSRHTTKSSSPSWRGLPRASIGPATSPTTGVQGKTDYLVIGQPTYLRGFDQLLQKTPLSTWKTYFAGIY